METLVEEKSILELKVKYIKEEINALHLLEYLESINFRTPPALYLKSFTNHHGIHPWWHGTHLLHLLKRENSKYIQKHKLYNPFTLMTVVHDMIDNYQVNIAYELTDICRDLFVSFYDDESIQTYSSKLISDCEQVILARQKHFSSEEFLYVLIRKNISELIPGAIIQKFTIIKNHIPDFMIMIHGATYPIEVKTGNIDRAALNQIRRYVVVYKCDKGFVMGSNLEVDLQNDPNIEFIDISHLKNKYYPQE